MALENQFEGIELTEKELRRLKRDALNAQFKKLEEEQSKEFPKERVYSSKPNYDIIAVKDLFRGTDISEEVISQELLKIEIRKAKRKNLPSKIKHTPYEVSAPIVILGVVIGLFGIVAYESFKLENRSIKFNELYNSSLIQYADINQDGMITPNEETIFDIKILKEHNLKYIYGERLMDTKYQNGETVSVQDLTQWIKEYDKKNSSK